MTDLEPKYALADAGFPVQEPVSGFALMLRQPNRLRLVNVGPELVRCAQERVEQLVPVEAFGYVKFRDYQISATGRFNVYDIILDRSYFLNTHVAGDVSPTAGPTREDMTLILVVLCRMLGAFFCYGYDVLVSSEMSRDLQTNCVLFLKLRDPRDVIPWQFHSHKFICIAPFANDGLILVNVPKTAVDQVIQSVHLAWSPGIKSKQKLADDERSVSIVVFLKLAGSPWNQTVGSSGKASVQARLIVSEVARILAMHKWRLALNVNVSGGADCLFFQWCPNNWIDFDQDSCRYAMLLLSRYDRLRLLHLPSSLTSSVRDAVNRFWYLQVLKQREYHGTTEFKLGGCPFWADSNDAVESKYFVSCLLATLANHGWEVCGTLDVNRHSPDKTSFVLKSNNVHGSGGSSGSRHHMCIAFCKTNRVRLIVSSSEVSESSELQLTTRLNDIIKRHWVTLGPRNYGKSIEWKLEGDPWDTEGLYSDQTRAIFLLLLIVDGVFELGWRLVASADVCAKNLDANERGYAMMGRPEDQHTWFFVHDPLIVYKSRRAVNINNNEGNRVNVLPSGSSVPNLDLMSEGRVLHHSEDDDALEDDIDDELDDEDIDEEDDEDDEDDDEEEQFHATLRQPRHSSKSDDAHHMFSSHSRSVPSVHTLNDTPHHVPSFNMMSAMPPSMMPMAMPPNTQWHPTWHTGHMWPAMNNRGVPNFFERAHPVPCYHHGQSFGAQRPVNPLNRQNSAGSLPPSETHFINFYPQPMMAETVFHCASHHRPNFCDNGDNDNGYKSDNDGYKSDGAYSRRDYGHNVDNVYNHQQHHQHHHEQVAHRRSSSVSRSHHQHQHYNHGYHGPSQKRTSQNGYVSDDLEDEKLGGAAGFGASSRPTGMRVRHVLNAPSSSSSSAAGTNVMNNFGRKTTTPTSGPPPAPTSTRASSSTGGRSSRHTMMMGSQTKSKSLDKPSMSDEDRIVTYETFEAEMKACEAGNPKTSGRVRHRSGSGITSKSLMASFDRQESATSFISTHSAPGVALNPVIPASLSHEAHAASAGGGGCGPQDGNPVGRGPPPPPTVMMRPAPSSSRPKHVHIQTSAMGRQSQMLTAPESVSTQSSSSSASAPPDYATCSHQPPSYDQALHVPPIKHGRRGRRPQQSTATNALHYMGEFYG